jgi:N-acetylglucosamine-6-phosphate deacetylase
MVVRASWIGTTTLFGECSRRTVLTVSVIPDGIHVSPPLFRLIHRVLGRERVCYVSDAMSAAGVAPGRYTLGRMELQVGADQVVRQPGSPLFAGSALEPAKGLRRAAEMLGCGLGRRVACLYGYSGSGYRTA